MKKLIVLAALLLVACQKDKKNPLYSSGPAPAGCNYVTANYFGVVGPGTSVAVAADPQNEPRDVVAVTICKGANCQNSFPAAICTGANPAGPCSTAAEHCSIGGHIPCDAASQSRFVSIAPGAVTFPGASADGYTGYAVSEADCQ